MWGLPRRSNLFVALAAEAARAARKPAALRLLAIAYVLGVAFRILKIIEWLPKVGAGITPGENLFFMYYYLMTGLHFIHMILGLIILAFVIRELKISKPININLVETGAVYWHVVDLLWLLLLFGFYFFSL